MMSVKFLIDTNKVLIMDQKSHNFLKSALEVKPASSHLNWIVTFLF